MDKATKEGVAEVIKTFAMLGDEAFAKGLKGLLYSAVVDVTGR